MAKSWLGRASPPRSRLEGPNPSSTRPGTPSAWVWRLGYGAGGQPRGRVMRECWLAIGADSRDACSVEIADRTSGCLMATAEIAAGRSLELLARAAAAI